MQEEARKTFSYLWWLVALTITGFLLISCISPFFIIFFDSNSFSNILASGTEGFITIFPTGWTYIYQNIPIYSILVLSLIIGLIGFSVVEGLGLFIRDHSKIFRIDNWLDSQEYATVNFVKFRIWLNKKPSEKACWDWEYFILLITVGITTVFFLCSLIYTIFFFYFYYIITTTIPLKGFLVLITLYILTFFSYKSYQRHQDIFNTTQNLLLEQLEEEKMNEQFGCEFY